MEEEVKLERATFEFTQKPITFDWDHITNEIKFL
jgi:hypothetical protein